MNPAVVATQVCGFKKVEQLQIGGFPNNFQGCFDNLFPVGGEGAPPFFSYGGLLEELSSGGAVEKVNFNGSFNALLWYLLMSGRQRRG